VVGSVQIAQIGLLWRTLSRNFVLIFQATVDLVPASQDSRTCTVCPEKAVHEAEVSGAEILGAEGHEDAGDELADDGVLATRFMNVDCQRRWPGQIAACE
jgi:hypothetical protein